jgi:hypothetical protein
MKPAIALSGVGKGLCGVEGDGGGNLTNVRLFRIVTMNSSVKWIYANKNENKIRCVDSVLCNRTPSDKYFLFLPKEHPHFTKIMI